jgi:hypothetical protein
MQQHINTSTTRNADREGSMKLPEGQGGVEDIVDITPEGMSS